MADKNIREVMTENPSTVEASANLTEAAQLMAKEDIGDVLVVENGELQGIVTDRDIVVKGLAEGNAPDDTSVREVATTEVATVGPDDTIEDAVKVVKEKDVRRIPVVEDGKPVGIVSLGDLAQHVDDDSALADISSASPNN